MIILRKKSFNDYVLQMFISENVQYKIQKCSTFLIVRWIAMFLDFRIIQIRFSTMFVVRYSYKYLCTIILYHFPFSSPAYEFHTICIFFLLSQVFFNPCHVLYLLSLLNFFFARLIYILNSYYY